LAKRAKQNIDSLRSLLPAAESYSYAKSYYAIVDSMYETAAAIGDYWLEKVVRKLIVNPQAESGRLNNSKVIEQANELAKFIMDAKNKLSALRYS
jgi:hypothetical protein